MTHESTSKAKVDAFFAMSPTNRFCAVASSREDDDLHDGHRESHLLMLLPQVQWDAEVCETEIELWDAWDGSDPFSVARKLLFSDTDGRYDIDAPPIAKRFAIAAVPPKCLRAVLKEGIRRGIFTPGEDILYGVDAQGNAYGLLETMILRSMRNADMCRCVRDALKFEPADLMRVFERVERRMSATTQQSGVPPAGAADKERVPSVDGHEHSSFTSQLTSKMASLSYQAPPRVDRSGSLCSMPSVVRVQSEIRRWTRCWTWLRASI